MKNKLNILKTFICFFLLFLSTKSFAEQIQFEAINIALKKEFRGLKKELLAGKTYESSVETINK